LQSAFENRADGANGSNGTHRRHRPGLRDGRVLGDDFGGDHERFGPVHQLDRHRPLVRTPELQRRDWGVHHSIHGTVRDLGHHNYVTTAAVSISLGPGINPYFAVQRTSPVVTELITGLLPVLNISAIVTLRGLLGNGCVTLAGDISLNAGDTIVLVYNATGATVTLQLGNSGANGIFWSVHRIA